MISAARASLRASLRASANVYGPTCKALAACVCTLARIFWRGVLG